MTKLKAWKAGVDRRLSALEAAIKNLSSRLPSKQNTSTERMQAHPAVQPESTMRSRLKMILKYGGIGLSLVATPLGIVTGALSLVPKISVSALEAQDPAIPFPAPFSVSSDGSLGIEKVKMSCVLIHVSDFTGHEFVTDAATTNFFPDIRHMEPGERATLPCVLPTKSMNPYVHDAEIAIVVNFRPDYIWRRQERRFLFYTLPQKNGILRWYQQPYSAFPDVTAHKAPFAKLVAAREMN
jgi:hypothetical protein